MTTLLTAANELSLEPRAGRPGDELWIPRDALAEATGWQLRDEGLCRGEVCVPLRETFADADEVHASALWRALGRPVLRDAAGSTWLLGEAAADRQRELETLIAPDFRLPDLAGRLHGLSDYRGHKVLLATWASW